MSAEGLASRIGKPNQNRAPRHTDPIWNLDKAKMGLDDYKQAVAKIRDLYKEAYEDEEEDLDSRLPSPEDLSKFVEDLSSQHGETAIPRFWRVLMSALIEYFGDYLEEEVRPVEEVYVGVMETLAEVEEE